MPLDAIVADAADITPRKKGCAILSAGCFLYAIINRIDNMHPKRDNEFKIVLK